MDFAPRQNFNISATILETTIAHAGLLGSPKPKSVSSAPAHPADASQQRTAGVFSAPQPAPAVPAVQGE